MVHTCNICNRVFEALRGLNIHYVACKCKELKSTRRVNNAAIEVITGTKCGSRNQYDIRGRRSNY